MTEASDTFIIDASKWIPAERVHAALNNICPPGAAFGTLNAAYRKAAVKSARVLLSDLKTFNSDTILVQLANAHDVGAATAQQIEDFIARYSVLRGRENSPQFCQEHDLDADSGLPWLLINDEMGRRCVVYFWLEDAQREWPDISKEPPPVKHGVERPSSAASTGTRPSPSGNARGGQQNPPGGRQTTRREIKRYLRTGYEVGKIVQEDLDPETRLPYDEIRRRCGCKTTADRGTIKNAVDDIWADVRSGKLTRIAQH
jgi:hypothetical protein